MWKNIICDGIEYPYAVSDYGAVISYHHNKPHPIKYEVDKDGYYRVQLHLHGKIKHFYVHRLVAMMFLPQYYQASKVVNHKDGNKQNNNVSNLEFIWGYENDRHAAIHGLKATGERNSLHHYSDALVRDLCIMLDKGIRPPKISKLLKVPVTFVYQIKYGKIRRHISHNFNFFKAISSTTSENQYYTDLIIGFDTDE